MISLPPVAGPISAQEHEVWRLLAFGVTDKDIAAHLCISRQTVDKHRTELYRKLGVQTKLMATLQAVRHGVISLPPRSSFEVSRAYPTNRDRRAAG